jgi:2-polyprenyl-3-methyl-5-hydroxy-6-metoxy-1,4-benzoquinol methylase
VVDRRHGTLTLKIPLRTVSRDHANDDEPLRLDLAERLRNSEDARLNLVRAYVEATKSCAELQATLSDVLDSEAYRLGRLLVGPVAFLKRGLRHTTARREPAADYGADELPSNLCIRSGYRSRPKPDYFRDLVPDGAPVQQPDVYPLAAAIGRRNGATRIIDVGCGQAGKLLRLADDFELIGIDFGENIDTCRALHPEHRWIEWDLELRQPLPLDDTLADGTIVVCADVIEHLSDPRPLMTGLRQLVDQGATLVLSTPERDRAHGTNDLGPPANPHHVREWTATEFENLLLAAHLPASFLGLTVNNSHDLQKNTSLAIVEPPTQRGLSPPPSTFRVQAVVHSFNERDVIVPIIGRLLRQEIEVILLDNWSTDGTVDVVRSAFGETALRVERFPERGPSGTWEWGAQLAYAETLLRARPGGWAIHHDADEIREPPWQNCDLRTGLWNVERRGYNAVDHTVVDFRPLGDSWREGADPSDAFEWFEFGQHRAHLLQVKAWRNDGQAVGLPESAGHMATAFEGARVFPYKFLLRHYSLRSPEHARRKVFAERRNRVAQGEHASGWHTHYDDFSDDTSFLWPQAGLHRFEPGIFPAQFFVERLSGVGIHRGPDGLSMFV